MINDINGAGRTDITTCLYGSVLDFYCFAAGDAALLRANCMAHLITYRA